MQRIKQIITRQMGNVEARGFVGFTHHTHRIDVFLDENVGALVIRYT